MNFKDKVALITGAAVGIGRATAIKLSSYGANVVLADIDENGLNNLKQELSEYNTKVLTYPCDVTDEDRVHVIVNDAIKKLGTIDILINNAAIWRGSSPFLNTPTERWRTLLDINIMGVVYFTKSTLPHMLDNGYGRIINIASVAGVYGNANYTAYSATKGAIISFTKALAKEVTDKGVLVNSISPGSVSPADNYDISYTEPSELSFMGRTGSDEENANLICFLASDKSSYISGQNIQIDGCRKKQ